MSDFNFDKIIDRRHTNSYKWDAPGSDDILPMWVADMDFQTAPCVIDALRQRVEHGVFGYTQVPEEYYQAVDNWFFRHHGWHVPRRHVIYTSGVVPAISAVIKALAPIGSKVIVQSPVYNCFFSSIRNNGCTMSDNKLRYNPDDGSYTIDFDDLEKKASDPDAKILLLCNPHNPAGRLWTRDELKRVGEICMRHDVVVVSDEIHCELTYNGLDYVPFASISEEFEAKCVVCSSPSKAFNIAGLQIANIVCADEEMRHKIDRAINDNEVCDVNPFGVVGLMAAYNEGYPWLEALRAYLWQNYIEARDFFARELPEFKVTPMQATYLMWFNISATGLKSDDLDLRLAEVGKVLLSPGSIYGPGGDDFLRLNLACPRALLHDGLQRIAQVLKPLVL